MKKLSLLLTSLCFSLSVSAESFVRGINYDPVHSVAFSHGMGTDDEGLMREAIFTDLGNLQSLAKAQGMEIHHLKTFFSAYSSLHNKVNLKVADVINQWNIEHPDYPFTLALGVYQFRPQTDDCKTEAECKVWTQKQVNAAKEALELYNGNQIPLIDRIVVGNENLATKGMESRLIGDIGQIKTQIQSLGLSGVSVGTAQIQSSVTDMYEGKKYGALLETADFIGINIYPYWSGLPYDKAKENFASVWNHLKQTKNWGKKPIIETEEGWPTGGDARGSTQAANDYFYYWFYGHAPSGQSPKSNEDYLVQTSYLFALNDKLPGQGVESHWGVFSADDSSNILSHFPQDKSLEPSLVFPKFVNLVGKDRKRPDFNWQNAAEVTVVACTEDKGEGQCYPLYGFNGSGKVNAASREKNPDFPMFAKVIPGVNQDLMIDTSNHYYKSLLVVLNKGTYPGLCWVDNQTLSGLNTGNTISIYWPDSGKPEPCEVH